MSSSWSHLVPVFPISRSQITTSNPLNGSPGSTGYAIDKTVYEVVFEYVDGNTPVIEVGFELTNELIPEEPEPKAETEPETKKLVKEQRQAPHQRPPLPRHRKVEKVLLLLLLRLEIILRLLRCL